MTSVLIVEDQRMPRENMEHLVEDSGRYRRVDMADRMGNTPLHVTGQINEPARALDLLNAGADPMARNAQGVTFQRYLFMTRAALLNAETRRQREAVEAWLKAHGIAIEDAR